MSDKREGSRPAKGMVLSSIPAFPPTVLQVLDLLAEASPDAATLTGTISSDPTLSSQVLRVANSPLFGFAPQVGSLPDAVTVLGFPRLQQLVLVVATSNYVRRAVKTEALRKCWRHTLATAVVCREIARAAGLPEDLAYGYGLLHDLGRLGFLAGYPDAYDHVLKAAGCDGESLLAAEKEQFGLDHCAAGRMLAERWNLPPQLRAIAEQHHDSPASGKPDFRLVVQTACRLADALGYDVAAQRPPRTFEELCSLLPARARETFPKNAASLKAIVDRTTYEHEFVTEMPPDAPAEARQRWPAPGKFGNTAQAVEPLDGTDAAELARLAGNPPIRELRVLITSALVSLLLLAVAYYAWRP